MACGDVLAKAEGTSPPPRIMWRLSVASKPVSSSSRPVPDETVDNPAVTPALVGVCLDLYIPAIG
jgi:hypothetical protein